MQSEKMLSPWFHAQKTPNKPAYIMANSGKAISYVDLAGRINRIAHLFRSLGLKRGDCIALYLENHLRYFEICWAALNCGLYIALLDSHLNADGVSYIVQDSNAVVLISSITRGNVADDVANEIKTLKAQFMLDGTTPDFESLEDVVAKMPSHPIADEIGGMYMLYTSGTTGRPKGVRRALPTSPTDTLPVRYGLYFQHLFGYNQSSIQLIPSHLYHSANINASIATVALGGTVIVMDQFSPQQALELIEKYEVTHSQWVPWHFNTLLMLENRLSYNVSSLKAALHTTAPCPTHVKQAMIEWWGPILYDDYGMTEGFGGCSITSKEWLKHPGSVGKAYIGTIHIVDEAGNELPSGEVGTIYFESDRAFEYYNNPIRTELARNEQGWATVGDVGYVDEEGYLYVIDRQDDMINVGGLKVYPQEVESVLIAHPLVMDVGVIGVPNTWLGEAVEAFVKLANGTEGNTTLSKALIKFCKTQLPTEKCPTSITFVEQLPRTPIGKLQRRKLRNNSDVMAHTPPPTLAVDTDSVEQTVKEIWYDVLNNSEINTALTFFENGGHSLELVQMIQQVQQQFGVDLPLGTFFNKPTIGRITDLVEGNINFPTHNSLTQMEADLNGTSSDLVSIKSFPSFKPNSVEAVFLTGANGFVGVHLLKKLLEHTDIVIYCLMRGESLSDAEARLQTRLAQIAPELSPATLSRLHLVNGDLTKTTFGLEESIWEKLCTTIDTIIHCGALVHHLYGYEQLRPANILGTQAVIRLASQGVPKGVYHISTLAAAPVQPKTVTLRERFPLSTERLPVGKSGYALTKFVAEQLISQAKNKGLAANIYRLGLISGDSTSGIWPAKGDHFMSLLKACLDLQAAPEMAYFIDWLPVDWLAQQLIDSILVSPTFGRTIHFSNQNGVQWNRLIQDLNRMGYPIKLMAYDAWKKTYLPNIPQNHHFYPLIPIYKNKSQAEVLAPEPEVECNILPVPNRLEGDLIQKYLRNVTVSTR